MAERSDSQAPRAEKEVKHNKNRAAGLPKAGRLSAQSGDLAAAAVIAFLSGRRLPERRLKAKRIGNDRPLQRRRRYYPSVLLLQRHLYRQQIEYNTKLLLLHYSNGRRRPAANRNRLGGFLFADDHR